MPQRNVNLTDHLNEFVDAKVASGRYSNASELVREGLRLLELREREEEAKIEWLRTAASEAFASINHGEGTSFGSMDELDAYVMKLSEEVFAEPSAS